MDNCVFCKILKHELPSFSIHETEDLITILSLENHPLIISKNHLTDIYELESDLGQKLMDEIILISKATQKSLNVDGIRVSQHNGRAAGQEVFHLHFHVIPAWEDDYKIDRDNQSPEYKQELADKIKSELDK